MQEPPTNLMAQFNQNGEVFPAIATKLNSNTNNLQFFNQNGEVFPYILIPQSNTNPSPPPTRRRIFVIS